MQLVRSRFFCKRKAQEDPSPSPAAKRLLTYIRTYKTLYLPQESHDTELGADKFGVDIDLAAFGRTHKSVPKAEPCNGDLPDASNIRRNSVRLIPISNKRPPFHGRESVIHNASVDPKQNDGVQSLVFLDFETSGFPKGKADAYDQLQNYKHARAIQWAVIHIRAQRTPSDTIQINEEKQYCWTLHHSKESGVYILPYITKLTGVTNKDVRTSKTSFRTAYMQLRNILLECDCVIAHNILFDIRILCSEVTRLGSEFREDADLLFQKFRCCTCQLGQDYLAATHGPGAKRPKLTILYKEIFGVEFPNAHNALADTVACKECYFAMVQKQTRKLWNRWSLVNRDMEQTRMK